MNNYEDYEYKPSNREKGKRAITGYNICYDCECRRPGGCKNCNPDKEFGKTMKKEGRVKKKDSI